jgi:hypothetical protein
VAAAADRVSAALARIVMPSRLVTVAIARVLRSRTLPMKTPSL